MKNFKPGDKVRLISGSDEMTVFAVFGYRLVECEWIGHEGQTFKNSFRPEYIELVSNIDSDSFSPQTISEKVHHQ